MTAELQQKTVSSCGTNTSDLKTPPKILTARKPPLPPTAPPPTEPFSKTKPGRHLSVVEVMSALVGHMVDIPRRHSYVTEVLQATGQNPF